MEEPRFSRWTVPIISRFPQSITEHIAVVDQIKAIMKREGVLKDEIRQFGIEAHIGGRVGLIKAARKWVNVQ